MFSAELFQSLILYAPHLNHRDKKIRSMKKSIHQRPKDVRKYFYKLLLARNILQRDGSFLPQREHWCEVSEMCTQTK